MQYCAPKTIAEAIGLLFDSKGEAMVLAGGTDLIVQMRAGVINPDRLIDIKRIPEAGSIVNENGGFRIGAAVCGAQISEHPSVGIAWPGVVEAIGLIGSAQVQGRASVAGNLCNASPAADSLPALIAARSICRVAGPKGIRDIPVEDIANGPGRNILTSGEFVISLFLPKRPVHSGDAYLRFTPRTEMDIAVVGAGVSLTLDDDGLCSTAHVALGAVAPTALLVRDAAATLIGTKLEESALDDLAAAASAACDPISDKRGTAEQRIKLAGEMARRVAKIAHERAKSN